MKSLAASYIAMLFIDTIGGGVKPFDGVPSYLPSPRRYLATFFLWGLFGLVAGVGPRAARLASRGGWITVLTATFVGPAGSRIVGFLGYAGGFFDTINTEQQGATG